MMSIVSVPAESLTQLSTGYKWYQVSQKMLLERLAGLGHSQQYFKDNPFVEKNGGRGRLSHIHHSQYCFYASTKGINYEKEDCKLQSICSLWSRCINRVKKSEAERFPVAECTDQIA